MKDIPIVAAISYLSSAPTCFTKREAGRTDDVDSCRMIDSQFYLLTTSRDFVDPNISSGRLKTTVEYALTSVMIIRSLRVSPHSVPMCPRRPEAKGDMFSAEPSLPCVAIWHQLIIIPDQERCIFGH